MVMEITNVLLDKIVLSINLVIFFVLYKWGAQYLAKRGKYLFLLKSHITVYYTDWLFLPFNLILPFVILFDFNLFLRLLILTTILSLFTHSFWFSCSKKARRGGCFFNVQKNKPRSVTVLHFFFTGLEMALIFIFFLSSPVNTILFYGEIFILFLFSLSFFTNSKKINGKFLISDGVNGLFLIGLIILKVKNVTNL